MTPQHNGSPLSSLISHESIMKKLFTSKMTSRRTLIGSVAAGLLTLAAPVFAAEASRT